MCPNKLIEEINRLRKEKNAVIMAHYYQIPEIQDIADFVGDSLELARKAKETNASIIVLCGVHFMAETAKIICPDKKVLIPDINAGCSLAESCDAQDLKDWKTKHPKHLVLSYVNTSAAVKALTDIVVTSSNALKIVEQLPKEQPILFCPDRNLGNYINSVTGRNMDLWNGYCHVHEKFSLQKLVELKQQYPHAKVLVHPECKGPIIAIADVIGSTKYLLNYTTTSADTTFLVATESGIIHKMTQSCPDKTFIPVPPDVTEGDKSCACNECNFMRMNTLEKLYTCLRDETNEINVDKNIAKKAIIPIEKMFAMSK